MHIIQLIDTKVYNNISYIINNTNTLIMKIISNLASATVLIFLALAFLVIIKNKKDAKLICLNLTLVFILNRILKYIIARPRPDALRLVAESGYSFPSAHSMVAIGFYGFLIYLISKRIENNKIKYSLISILSLTIFLIGISRIYLGVHYATDVIGGFILGGIYLIFFIKLTYKEKI